MNKVKPPFDEWHMYCAGRRVKLVYQLHQTWMELINSDEWDFCVTQFKLTKDNIAHFKDGYKGQPFRNPKVVYFYKESTADVIIPFGVYRGTPISQLDMKVIVRMSEQPWITKWPNVASWMQQNKDKIEAYKKEYEEGMSDLKSFGEALKGNY